MTSCEVIEEEGRGKVKEQGRKGKGKKERGKKDESHSESVEEEEEEGAKKKKKKKDASKAMSLLNKRRYGLSAQKKTPGADSESESEEERPGRAYMLKEVSTPVTKGVEKEFEVNLRAAQRFCDQLLDTSDSDEDEMEKEKGGEFEVGKGPGWAVPEESMEDAEVSASLGRGEANRAARNNNNRAMSYGSGSLAPGVHRLMCKDFQLSGRRQCRLSWQFGGDQT